MGAENYGALPSYWGVDRFKHLRASSFGHNVVNFKNGNVTATAWPLEQTAPGCPAAASVGEAPALPGDRK